MIPFKFVVTDLQINVIEHTRISPKFIDNEDTGIYYEQLKHSKRFIVFKKGRTPPLIQ